MNAEMIMALVIISFVAGASFYTRYCEGIEIEVDTIPEERWKHLTTVACSTLILNCLEEGIYPGWDAQNMNSVQYDEVRIQKHEYTK